MAEWQKVHQITMELGVETYNEIREGVEDVKGYVDKVIKHFKIIAFLTSFNSATQLYFGI